MPKRCAGSSSHEIEKDDRRHKRKRTRKEKEIAFIGGEPTAPTPSEWKTMKTYTYFGVLDSNGDPSQFHIDDYALILPDGKGLQDRKKLSIDQYWTGKIKDIRARAIGPTGTEANDIWVKVQWLYHPSDIAAIRRAKKKGFDMRMFSKMEKVNSKHFDFVHVTCFEDLIKVYFYDESADRPHPIRDGDVYYRAGFNLVNSNVKFAYEKTCLCGVPYNPDTRANVMHFCPRCEQAYHARCLHKKQRVDGETMLDEQRRSRSEYMEVFVSLRPELPDALPPHVRRGKKGQPSNIEQCSTLTNSLSICNASVTSDRHDLLPDELLALARSPMVKGKGANIPDEWTITGNLAVVSRARELVVEVLMYGNDLHRKWEHIVGFPGLEEGKYPDIMAWVVPDEGFSCPGCEAAI